FVEPADRFLLGDSFVALQPLDDRSGRRGDSIGKLSLAAPGRAFHQQRFLHARREISYFEPHRIDHVSGRPKLFRKLTKRTEHFDVEPYSGKSWTPNFGERETGQPVSGAGANACWRFASQTGAENNQVSTISCYIGPAVLRRRQ